MGFPVTKLGRPTKMRLSRVIAEKYVVMVKRKKVKEQLDAEDVASTHCRGICRCSLGWKKVKYSWI